MSHEAKSVIAGLKEGTLESGHIPERSRNDRGIMLAAQRAG